MENNFILNMETCSTSPNAAIAHIMLGQIDLKSGNITNLFVESIDVSSLDTNLFQIDEKTIEFWENQPTEIQQFVFESNEKLNVALDNIIKFIPLNSYIWCNTYFEAPILNNAFKVLDKFIPWKYNNYRDLNTLSSLLSNVELPKKVYNPGIDIVARAKFVAQAIQKIKEPI